MALNRRKEREIVYQMLFASQTSVFLTIFLRRNTLFTLEGTTEIKNVAKSAFFCNIRHGFVGIFKHLSGLFYAYIYDVLIY